MVVEKSATNQMNFTSLICQALLGYEFMGATKFVVSCGGAPKVIQQYGKS